MCGITGEVAEQLKSQFSAVVEMGEYELSDWGSVKNSKIIEFVLQYHIQNGFQTYSTFWLCKCDDRFVSFLVHLMAFSQLCGL